MSWEDWIKKDKKDQEEETKVQAKTTDKLRSNVLDSLNPTFSQFASAKLPKIEVPKVQVASTSPKQKQALSGYEEDTSIKTPSGNDELQNWKDYVRTSKDNYVSNISNPDLADSRISLPKLNFGSNKNSKFMDKVKELENSKEVQGNKKSEEKYRNLFQASGEDMASFFTKAGQMIHKPFAEATEKIVGRDNYKAEDDVIQKGLTKAYKDLKAHADSLDPTDENTPMVEKLMNMAGRTLPSMIATGQMGGALGNLSKVKELGKFEEAIKMIPFLANSFGQGSLEGEEKGGNYATQLKKGLISAGVEGATESNFMPSWFNKLLDGGLGEVEAKTIKESLKELGMDTLKEGGQEAIGDPINNLGDKYLFENEKDKKIFGQGGVIDPRQMREDFLGGAMIGGIGGVPNTMNSIQSIRAKEQLKAMGIDPEAKPETQQDFTPDNMVNIEDMLNQSKNDIPKMEAEKIDPTSPTADINGLGTVEIIESTPEGVVIQGVNGSQFPIRQAIFSNVAQLNPPMEQPTVQPQASKLNAEGINVLPSNNNVIELPAPKNDVLKTLDIKPEVAESNIKSVPLSSINVDPERFQFKGNTDSAGVTNQFKNGETFNKNMAGIITLWKDNNNKLWVVNGHHRVEFANRSGVDSLNAQILDEKDGWSEKDVRTLGAKINIADGKGTAVDSAKIFKENNMSIEDLKKEGMSLSENKVKTGFFLSKLESHVFNKVVNGEITESKGAIIGENFPNDSTNQNAVISLLNEYSKKGKNISDNVFKEIIDMVKASETTKTEQSTLFGIETIAKSNMVERGEIITGIKHFLNKEKKVFENLSNSKKAEIIEKAGNVLAHDNNLENKNMSELAIKIVEGFKNSKGTPIADVISKYTKAYSEGTMDKNEAVTKAYLEIKKLIKGGKYLGENNDGNSKTSTTVSASGQIPEGKGLKNNERAETESQVGATKNSQNVNKKEVKPVKPTKESSQKNNKEGKKYEKEKSKEELKKQTDEAIKDVKATERTNISREGRTNYFRGLKGLAISTQFMHKGRVDLIGQVIDSPEKLVTLAQVYRDPRFETFRIFYMKGDTVLGHEGITSKMPSMVLLHESGKEGFDKFYKNINKRMSSLGADSYYLLHNHPSGNPTPSKSDFDSTENFRKRVGGFKGHIIIDSNKYAHIRNATIDEKSVFGEPIIHEINDLNLGEDKLLYPSIEHPLLNKKITSGEAFAELSKQMEMDKTMHTIVYVTAKKEVRAIQEVPDITFNKYDFAVRYLKNRMREFGTSDVFIVSGQNTNNDGTLKRLIEDGLAVDVYSNFLDNNLRSLGTAPSRYNDPNSWGSEKAKPFKVMEEKSLYNMKVFESKYWQGEMHPWGLEVRTKERIARLDNQPKRSYSFSLDKYDMKKPNKELIHSWEEKILKDEKLNFNQSKELLNILDHFVKNQDKYFKNDSVKEEKEAYNLDLEKKAIEHFGTTTNFKEAGYLTTSGKLLDFSGKRQGASGGYRTQDHREVQDIMDSSGTQAMTDFMDMGNIRLQETGFELTQKPTAKQLPLLKRLIDRLNGEVNLDLSVIGKHNSAPEYIEYPEGTRAEKILRDIYNFYDNGKVNDSIINKFHETKEEYNTDPAPAFYSQLERVVEAKVGNKISPEELKKNIDSWALKGLIKPEEVKWSGIKEWLDSVSQTNELYKGIGTGFEDSLGIKLREKLSKEEILKQLQDSRVKIEEVTKDNKIKKLKEKAFADYEEVKNELNREKIRLSNTVYNVLKSYDNNSYEEAEKLESLLSRYTKEAVEGTEMTSEFFVKLEGMSKKYNLDYTKLINLAFKTKKALENYKSFIGNFDDRTKYDSYKVKGGENYTELLFTMPKNDYISSHWNEEGVIAHTRFTDRIDHEGKKVLFLEEVQSDLHQAGRKKGYRATREQLTEAKNKRDNYYSELMKKYGDDTIMNDEYEQLTEEENQKREELEIAVTDLEKRQYGVPEAPFSKTWHEFILKRMIRYASENGYDKLAWATGEQNADHYDLRKFVSNIKYHKNNDNTYELVVNSTDGDILMDKGQASLQEIEELLGKDIAERIGKDEGKRSSGGIWGILQGDGLAFGGEGMQGFYNKIIPTFLNKYLKKWGAKVEETILGKEINNGKSFEENKKIATEHPEMNHTVQQSVTINDKMRNDVLYDGQALFEDSSEYNTAENSSLENEIKTIEQSIEKGNVPPELVQSVVQRLSDLKSRQAETKAGTKDRKHAETYQNSEFMHPEVKLLLAKKDTSYKPISERETWEKALDYVYKHYDEAYHRIKSLKSMTSAEDTAIGEAILYKLQSEKRFVEASEWAVITTERATGTAQALHMLSIVGRLSPEGILRTAQRELNKGSTEGQRKTVDRKSKEAEEGFKDIIDSVIDDVGKKAEDYAKNKNIKGRKSNVKDTSSGDQNETAVDTDTTPEENIINGAVNKNLKELPPEVKVAKKVENHMNEPKAKVVNPMEDMIRTLYSVAKENLPEKQKNLARNPMEFITQAIKNKAEYKDIWTKAQEIVKERFKDNPEALLSLQNYFGHLLEKPFATKDLEKSIKISLKELGINLSELVKEHYTKVNAVGKTLEEKLMDKGLDKKEAEELAGYIKEQFNKMTAKKKEQLLNRMFGHPKTKKQKQLFEKIFEWSNLGAIDDTKFRSYVAEKLGIPSINEELAKDLVQRATNIQTMPEGEEKYVEIALMLDRIAREIPPTKWEKINTTQTIFMLLNPKTYIRNALGNAVFGVVDRYLTYPVAKLTDLTTRMVKRTGESTIALPSPSKYMSGLVQGTKKGVKYAKLGINMQTNNTAKIELPKVTYRKETAKGIAKIVQMHRLETLLRISLQATDDGFKQATIRESLSQQMKLKGVNEPTQAMIDRAVALADYRTFQHESSLASLFSGLKKLLNNPTYFVTGGKKGKKRAWGMGDVVLKFPRVPANLLDIGIDYSPIGVAKAFYHIYEDSKAHTPFNQFQFSMDFSRGVTGTTIIALGIALAKLGLLSGRGDDDEDLRNIEEDTGFGQYRINLSGLIRYVNTGSIESAVAQENDTTVDYSWLQPNGLALAIGSDIVRSKKILGLDTAQSIVEAVSSGANTIAEQPMLSGLRRMAQSRDIVQGLASGVKSVPSSFVPSLFNQFRQLEDNASRSTMGKNWGLESMNMAINRVPIVSRNLLPRIDSLGHEKEVYQNQSNNLWNVFLNPSFTKKYKPTDEQQLVLDIFKESGNKIQVPRVAPKTVTFDGDTYKLTPQEYHDYQLFIGEQAEYELSKIPAVSLKPDEQAQKIKTTLDKINEKAKKEFLIERGINPNVKKKK